MKQNLSVLVTNTTDKDQSVILIPTNEAIVISPGAGAIIDTYTKKHYHIYSSYARKGMKVTKVNDSYFDNAVLAEEDQKLINETESKLPEITLENINEEKTVEAVETEEATTDESVEDKPKRKKSSKKVSESSEEISATTESGE